jgi:hypothetical protein
LSHANAGIASTRTRTGTPNGQVRCLVALGMGWRGYPLTVGAALRTAG